MAEDTRTDRERRFQEVVEGPKAVFTYRIITGVGTIIIAGMVTALLTYAIDVNRSIIDLRVAAATAIGRADLLVDKINAHASRLDRLDGRQDKLDERITNIQLDKAR